MEKLPIPEKQDIFQINRIFSQCQAVFLSLLCTQPQTTITVMQIVK